jgi:DNA-binding NarL/FixJ family response regulator
MLHVLVVSPLPSVRAGLRALIGAAAQDAVIDETEHYEPPSDAFLEASPDVIVLDVRSIADLDWLGESDTQRAGPGLIVLGPLLDDEQLPARLAGRAWGYLPRDAGGSQISAAVSAVGAGLTVLDWRLGARLLAPSTRPLLEPPALDAELTARELEVLALVAQGLPNKTIAAQLAISEHTVKFHVASILAKLGAGSRTEAVHLGARRGLTAL